MELLDGIAEIELHLASISLLTDQIVALSGRSDQKSLDEINALDTARIATQKSVESIVSGLENYVKYGLKVGAKSCA